MIKFLNILILFICIQSLNCNVLNDAIKVKEWAQCGGKGYSGPFECQSGLKCLKLNDWYHHCVGMDYNTESSKKTTTSSTLMTSILTTTDNYPFAREWDQCGGINFTGKTECATGLICERLNDWFFQCKRPKDKRKAFIYEQCGGLNFSGNSECGRGLVCFKMNEWYSQCLPYYQPILI